MTALLWDKIPTIHNRHAGMEQGKGRPAMISKGSLRFNNNGLIALYPSDPMEFLGPIMVHLREEFGSDNLLKRFCNSPS